jgi:uncharacterized protein YyaL (SSP411 family)
VPFTRKFSTALAILLAASGCSKNQKIKTIVSTNSSTAVHAHTNRLTREKSPYLLQHAHNPVDWFPWGEEAFTKARAENKPIFLSIGYSTCHWCHVMERESFENETVAKFLNEHFVSIKVDREERPDVDKIYMTAAQAMTGQGGWPLNCFLTPDLKPFFAGTYFPPEPKYGRPSFLQLLQQIAEVWKTKRDEVAASAEDMHKRLDEFTSQQTNANVILSPAILYNAAAQFKAEYDPVNGGFGGAPKFPRPSVPIFLLRNGVRLHDDEAVKMVLHTCDKMAAGGMHDQLGGGFARYSVDAQWLVPHFEKMLYDNAQLANLYLDAFLVSGEKRYADVARDIIAYVLRDMTHSDGGFFSAEDADSEGKEGKFYCWTKSELSKLLTVEEFNVAVRYFGITGEGNFVDHSDPNPLPNQNVLSIVNADVAEADKPLLASAKKKMFDARAKRIRPHLDDKVLASWNGMMLGAIARAYAILGDEKYRDAAEKNLTFLQSKLWDAKTKTLYHRWRDGERDSVQLLDAYSDLLAGVLDLYEATLEPKHLDFAIALAETMLAEFYDSTDGGFYQSAADSKDLILRVKEDYDGAEPSGNSVATLALLKLAAITNRAEFKNAAEKTLRLLAERMQKLPQAVPHSLIALDFFLEEPKRAVIVGNASDTKSLLRVIHSVYQPNKVVLGNSGAVESFAKTLPTKDAPIVFLCAGTACQPPTRNPGTLKDLLK